MSLRALMTGVTGLRNFSNGLDVIGNNIANVGTTGYKGSE
jgi:flagellar hook protein FlgE